MLTRYMGLDNDQHLRFNYANMDLDMSMEKGPSFDLQKRPALFKVPN